MTTPKINIENEKLRQMTANLGTIEGKFEHPYADKLTVIMIVKDEEKYINDAIDNFKHFADEIIVNDTGSTDKTIEIINEKKLDTVRLVQSKWEDDFAKARNTSLGYASYGWVMWLDADDRVPQTEYQNIRKLKTAPLDRFFEFRVTSTIEGLPVGATFFQPRMFPNVPGVHFKNCIHEQVLPSLAKLGLKPYKLPVSMHHIGYDGVDMTSKQERNYKLMQKGDITTPSMALAYADTTSGLGNLDECVEVLLELERQIDDDVFPEFTESTYVALGIVYMKKGENEQAAEWLDKCITRLDGVYYRGVLYKLERDYPNACKKFEKVIDLPEPMGSGINPYHETRIKAYGFLCAIYRGLGLRSKAVKLEANFAKQYPEPV